MWDRAVQSADQIPIIFTKKVGMEFWLTQLREINCYLEFLGEEMNSTEL
jgi:hypothetical protein